MPVPFFIPAHAPLPVTLAELDHLMASLGADARDGDAELPVAVLNDDPETRSIALTAATRGLGAAYRIRTTCAPPPAGVPLDLPVLRLGAPGTWTAETMPESWTRVVVRGHGASLAEQWARRAAGGERLPFELGRELLLDHLAHLRVVAPEGVLVLDDLHAWPGRLRDLALALVFDAPWPTPDGLPPLGPGWRRLTSLPCAAETEAAPGGLPGARALRGLRRVRVHPTVAELDACHQGLRAAWREHSGRAREDILGRAMAGAPLEPWPLHATRAAS